MNAVGRWFRSPPWQRVGRSTGLLGRHLSGRLFEVLLPMPANQRIADLPPVRRVLLVRPNFRIGNTILATPLIPALRDLFPGAQLEILGTENTQVLLEHLSVDQVHVVSRRFILRPWKLLGLLRRLRREHIDVAVEAGMGSFSGGLYAWLSGARFRVGVEGAGARFLNVRVPRPRPAHVYDRIPTFARSLGATCTDNLIYRVSAAESAAAEQVLRERALDARHTEGGFVALFVGGHLDKRLPHDRWLDAATRLDAAGVRFVLLVGPEEHDFQRRLAAHPTLARHVVPPQPLRTFAAILARAALVVTTDSGPMHLAVALERPTIALLARERSRRFQPRGNADRALMMPTAAEIVAAIESHPAFADVAS
jgi:heptosyltransferase-3